MIAVTACPEAMIDDANHYAASIGLGPADLETFKSATWQDSEGNLYACTAPLLSDAAAQHALNPTVTRPAWDTDEIIDLEAAQRTRDAMLFDPDAEPAPGVFAVRPADGNALAVLAAMGLTRIEE